MHRGEPGNRELKQTDAAAVNRQITNLELSRRLNDGNPIEKVYL